MNKQFLNSGFSVSWDIYKIGLIPQVKRQNHNSSLWRWICLGWQEEKVLGTLYKVPPEILKKKEKENPFSPLSDKRCWVPSTIIIKKEDSCAQTCHRQSTVNKSHCWAGLCSFSLGRWQRRTAETRALPHLVKHWEVKWLLTGRSHSQEGMGQDPRKLHPSLLLYQENAMQGRERPQGPKDASTADGTLDAVWVTFFMRVRAWRLDRLEHMVSRLGSHTVGKHLPRVVRPWVINNFTLFVETS